MRMLSPSGVSKRAVETLGLDPALLDLTAVEAVACGLRRAAAFLCPCSGRTLVRSVFEPLRGVHEDAGLLALVEDTLEAVVAHGDLLELHNPTHEATTGTLLFVAPPSFVSRKSDAVMLLGIGPDGVFPLPESLGTIEHQRHVRIVKGKEADLGERLAELGLIELELSTWTKAPNRESAEEHLRRMRQLLMSSQACGDLPGLVLLNPETSVRYYRGRWVEPSRETGQFVGRRPQAYGADLWCYVDVEEGHAVRLVDLPTREDVGRGCDEAWRLQAAIDYVRGSPQLYRVRPGPGAFQFVDYFSPVPKWAHRRWETIGEPATCSGCLFTYKLSEAELDGEIKFAREYLWLRETEE